MDLRSRFQIASTVGGVENMGKRPTRGQRQGPDLLLQSPPDTPLKAHRLIERLLNTINPFRRIATRCDKRAENDAAAINPAAARNWVRNLRGGVLAWPSPKRTLLCY